MKNLVLADRICFNYYHTLPFKYYIDTFIYFKKYISLGEKEDIRDRLPKDLIRMIYSNLMF